MESIVALVPGFGETSGVRAGHRFTDRQLDMMNILWNQGSATVREAGRTALEYVTRRLFENSPEALVTSLEGVADGTVPLGR